MRAVTKGFKRMVDVRDRCGRLDLKADCDEDALLLARIARLLFYSTPEDRQRFAEFLLPK